MLKTLTPIADKALSRLAEGATRIERVAVAILLRTWPRLAAIVELRRGNLTSARNLSKAFPQSRAYLRAQQMLQCLEHGFPLPTANAAPRSFDGRVLYVVHSSGNFDPNGYAVRSAQTLQALSDEKLELIAATRLGYPWDLAWHADKPVETSTTHRSQPYVHSFDPAGGISQPEIDYVQAYARYLKSLAKQHDVTAIHANSNFLNGLAACIAAREAGIRCIYEMRGLWHLTRASRQPGYVGSEHFAYCQAMEIQAASAADHVVVISAAMVRWLVEHGVDESKISVVPNAANVETKAPSHPKSPIVPTARIEIGYVGAITEYEGLEVLMGAIAKLTVSGLDIHLTIAGDGPHARALQRHVAQQNLSDTVSFLGRVSAERAVALYRDFDLCVLARRPSLVTQLVAPLKAYEIMLHRTPLIASDLPPLREITQDGKLALLVRPDDEEALAGAIREVITNGRQTGERTETAYRSVKEDHNWQANARRYHAIYSGISASLANTAGR